MEEKILVGIIAVFGGLFLFGIKAMVTATFQNTVAVKLLTSKIDEIVKNQEEIPEMKKDIKELGKSHRKIIEQFRPIKE